MAKVFQLVDRACVFNVSELEQFIQATKMGRHGLKYSVISVLGLQDNGTRTLINTLFEANFENAMRGSSLDDKGIWLAKSTNMKHFTVLMDLQSIFEKGDTKFEKKSIMFSLAVSDVMLITMSSDDIENKNVTNILLISLIFQAMVRLANQRESKITLLFVVKDASHVTLEPFETILREDIQKIWNSIVRPTKETSSPTDFFDIEVATLAYFQQNEESFENQVAKLRRLCYSTVCRQFVSNHKGVYPASIFASFMREVWNFITDDKPLEFGDFKEEIFVEYCIRTANEAFSSFCKDEEWCNIKMLHESEIARTFGSDVSRILKKYLTDYDTQTCFVDSSARTKEMENLKACFSMEIYDTYSRMTYHICEEVIKEFKENFEKEIERKNIEEYSIELIITSINFSRDEFKKKYKDILAIEEIKYNPSMIHDEVYNAIRNHVTTYFGMQTQKSGKHARFYSDLKAAMDGKKTAETSSSDQTIP